MKTNKFEIVLTKEVMGQLQRLKKNNQVVHKAVSKTINYMNINLRHPSLNTHEFTSLKGERWGNSI